MKEFKFSIPVFYSQILNLITLRAKELGYAIAVHGSMTRDLDIIAVPWIQEAVSAEELVEAICELLNGFYLNYEDAEPDNYIYRNPEPKPHGRLAWSIHLRGFKGYVDLSVMPRIEKI